jgi:L-lactate dehydrogenase complex protein LldG
MVRLEQMAAPIHLQVRQVDDLPGAAAAIAELVANTPPEWGRRKQVAAWRHPLIEGLNLHEALKPQAVPVVYAPLENDVGRGVDAVQRADFRAAVAASYVGVTSADYCVADSATLVMKTRPGQARSVSLVPSVHVSVIRARRIIADLGELFALLTSDPDQRAEGLTNCLTFISGPSKTADIEAHMVHGAHGPRELHLLILKG